MGATSRFFQIVLIFKSTETNWQILQNRANSQLFKEVIRKQVNHLGSRLRVLPLSFSPSCVTRKKTARRKWLFEILSWEARPYFHARLAPSISRGHIFLAVFFRVTHNGLNERGTTRSLFRVIRLVYTISSSMNVELFFRNTENYLRIRILVIETNLTGYYAGKSSGRKWAESGRKNWKILILPSLLLLPRSPRETWPRAPKTYRLQYVIDDC